VLALLQGSSLLSPSSAVDCQEVQRIELSRTSGAPQEICVSPGLRTRFVFDSQFTVNLQDEARFVEVIHGRTTLGLLPPGDMGRGERLRLTVYFKEEASSDGVTFVLVARQGQATRQVEVYSDRPSRASFQQEVAQEHANDQRLQSRVEQLQHQLELLRAECDDPSGLRRLLVSGEMDAEGIRARRISVKSGPSSKSLLFMVEGHIYRSSQHVVVAVMLRNASSEPWTADGALLVDKHGKNWKAIRIWASSALLPDSSQLVVLEVRARGQELQGDVTVKLWGAESRGISIHDVPVP
jgi:uncharacterized protein (TIGR02268 family)